MSEIASVSLVIPVYNEAESLPILIEQIMDVMPPMDYKMWEVILIDDGSSDGSTKVMQDLCEQHQPVRCLYLMKNFGKSTALQAGFEAAQGDAIITLDSDLQDDPKEIPALLAELDKGFDVVSGWKKERSDPLEKRWASKIFNVVVSAASRIPLHDFNCGLKGYRAWALEGVILRGNMHRYIPMLLSQRGATITEVVVNHNKRVYGKSKYGLLRYFHGLFDLMTVIFLTRFFQNPLYFFGLVGLPFIVLGSSLGAFLLMSHICFLFGAPWAEQLVSRPLLIICVSMFGFGLQILLTGLVCEFLLRLRDNDRSYWEKSAEQPAPPYSKQPPPVDSVSKHMS